MNVNKGVNNIFSQHSSIVTFHMTLKHVIRAPLVDIEYQGTH